MISAVWSCFSVSVQENPNRWKPRWCKSYRKTSTWRMETTNLEFKLYKQPMDPVKHLVLKSYKVLTKHVQPTEIKHLSAFLFCFWRFDCGESDLCCYRDDASQQIIKNNTLENALVCSIKKNSLLFCILFIKCELSYVSPQQQSTWRKNSNNHRPPIKVYSWHVIGRRL